MVTGVIGGVCRKLGGRYGDDQPSAAGVNLREFEHISQEGAEAFCVLA